MYIRYEDPYQLKKYLAALNDYHVCPIGLIRGERENTMKSIDEIKNYDELVDEIAETMYQHDKECTRVDEAIWIDLNEKGIASVVVTSADTWKLGSAEFLGIMKGTYEDELSQLISIAGMSIADFADAFDMAESDLILYASEYNGTDIEDTDIDQVEDYIRSVPELMGKVEEAFLDWLEISDYETIAEEYLNNLERTLQYR